MQFVEQIAAVGMTPSGAGVVVADEGVRQSALAEKRGLAAQNESIRRIEAVPVQAEVEAIVLRVAVVNLGKQRPVVAKSFLHSKIRLDGIQRVGDILQIDGVAGVWCRQ